MRDAKESLEGEQYPDWMLPVDQMGSIATFAAQLGNGTGAQPFKTVKDYDNWLARGNRIPVLVDSIIADMQAGIAAGVVQPKALMVKVVPQYDAIIRTSRGQPVLGPDREHAQGLQRRRQGAPHRRLPRDDRRQDDARVPQAARLHRQRLPAQDARQRGPEPASERRRLVRLQVRATTTTDLPRRRSTRSAWTRSRASTARCAR